jgi:hypothetical protein
MGNRSQQGTTKNGPQTKFEALVAKAMDALREALDQKEADNISLSVWKKRADGRVELFYEERELEGTIDSSGLVSLGRIP